MQGLGGEFGAMMQQAAAIKSQQVKQERKMFEKQPVFLQNTLFQCVDEQVQKARDVQDAVERLALANEIKEAGNEAFKKSDYYEANDKYERSIGCFWYIMTSERDWKKVGVKDEHLSFRKEGLDVPEVRGFVVTCLNNIAACQTQLEQWNHCISACDSALELDPTNVKALYRRAQARTLPISAGAAELDMAIKDLRTAAKSNPADKAVRKRLGELADTKKRQMELDKETFVGMFDRGELVPEQEEEEKDGSKNTRSEEANIRQQLDYYKNMSHHLKLQGKLKDAEELERVVKSTEQKLQAKKAFEQDIFEPTPEMIREAKENFNLDLTNPEVQQEMKKIMAEQSNNSTHHQQDQPANPEPEEASGNKMSPAESNLSIYIIAIAVLLGLFSSLWQSPMF